MKKLFVLLLPLVLILSLAACGDNSADKQDDSARLPEKDSNSYFGSNIIGAYNPDMDLRSQIDNLNRSNLTAAEIADIEADAKENGYEVEWQSDGSMVIIEDGSTLTMSDKWPENEFTASVPAPSKDLIAASNIDEDECTIIMTWTVADAKAYAGTLKEAGFTQCVEEQELASLGLYSYTASNGEYTVSATIIDSQGGINIERTESDKPEDWENDPADYDDIIGDIDYDDILGDIDYDDIMGNLDYDDILGDIDYDDIMGDLDYDDIMGDLDYDDIMGDIDYDDIMGDIDYNDIMGDIDYDDIIGDLDYDDILSDIDYEDILGGLDYEDDIDSSREDEWPDELRKYPGGIDTDCSEGFVAVHGTTMEEVRAYVALLKQDGFTYMDFYDSGMSEEQMLTSLDQWNGTNGTLYLEIGYGFGDLGLGYGEVGTVTIEYMYEKPSWDDIW